MLAIVRIALRRPYTFIVAGLLILLIGTLAALRMPVDIFPSIDIPIIGVAWQYQGLPPDQMAGRILTPFERSLTTTVNDIEHIEANSYTTFGIVKIFFHPSVNIATANAQVTAIAQTLLKQMPPGATPPLVVNYSASTVPIIQLALSGLGLTEQNLADLGMNFVRPRLVTVQGAAIPWPFGGKTPQVMFDLDTAALQSRGLTGLDVANALAAQNLNTPAGTEKIGNYEYTVNLNSAPSKITDQHRARRRESLGAAQRLQERNDFDTRHRQRHQEDAGHPQAIVAGYTGGQAYRRSVGVRARLDPGCGPRRRDRCGADQLDDPAFPRQLALDPDRHHVDSAGDPRRDRRACSDR
jgi:multidrug efflux pump subunit AcrB